MIQSTIEAILKDNERIEGGVQDTAHVGRLERAVGRSGLVAGSAVAIRGWRLRRHCSDDDDGESQGDSNGLREASFAMFSKSG